MMDKIEVMLTHSLEEPAIEFAQIAMELNTLSTLYGGTPEITSVLLDENKKQVVLLCEIANLNQVQIEIDDSGAIFSIHGGRMEKIEDRTPEKP